MAFGVVHSQLQFTYDLRLQISFQLWVMDKSIIVKNTWDVKKKITYPDIDLIKMIL